jgi:phasin
MNPRPGESRKTDDPKAFGQIAEATSAQAQQAYEKAGATAAESANLIKNSYSAVVAGVQDYNNKLVEFAHMNTNAAFDFVQRLSRVKSPTEFIALSSEHARKQFETLTDQTQQLVTLAQKAAATASEPIRTAVTNTKTS